jgi:hypothetical protein
MKKNISVRSRQSSRTATNQTLPLLLVISILAIVFVTVFHVV